MRGIGEVIDPLPYQPLEVTLVVPPLVVPTPDVYRAWDELGGPSGGGPNDLTAAALAVAPELAEWRDRIRECSGVEPVLAGSGATWFLVGHHEGLAEALDGARVLTTRAVG